MSPLAERALLLPGDGPARWEEALREAEGAVGMAATARLGPGSPLQHEATTGE